MIENAILWLSLIWLPLLLYFILRNEAKFKKNIAVGVTLPFEGRRHPDVLARLERFKKHELLVCIGLMLCGIPGIFLEFTMSFSLWFVWMTACIIVPYVPYVLCNRDLKRIKTENGWRRPSAVDTVIIDLSAIPEQKWLSPWIFAPAVVFSLLPILFGRSFWFMYLLDAVMVVFCWLGYRYLFRNKAEIVDSNTTVTAALTRVRRCQWGKMWLLCAYSLTVINWLAAFTMYSPTFMTVGVILFTLILVIASMRIEFQTRRLQERLTADSGKDFYVDDDDKWLGGIVYYNPNDSRLLINERVGTNSSVNLAKPAGKLLYGLIVVLILTLPLWGLALGDNGIITDIRSDSVFISGGMHEYTIETEDIVSVELLDELPAIARIAGTGLPELLGGNFSSKEYGKLKVCLDPTTPPFILVETESQTYLLGTKNKQQTMGIYEVLK